MYIEEKSIKDGHFGHCFMEIFMDGMVHKSCKKSSNGICRQHGFAWYKAILWWNLCVSFREKLQSIYKRKGEDLEVSSLSIWMWWKEGGHFLIQIWPFYKYNDMFAIFLYWRVLSIFFFFHSDMTCLQYLNTILLQTC